MKTPTLDFRKADECRATPVNQVLQDWVLFVINSRFAGSVLIGSALLSCYPSAISRAHAAGPSDEVLVSEPWTAHSCPAGGGTSILKLTNGDIVNQYWEGDGLH